MSHSLNAVFGETLAPILEKMKGDSAESFQIDINSYSLGNVHEVYDFLRTNIKNGASFDETDLAHFALLLGAKNQQKDFHPKEQAKLSDIRDYFMLGIARDRIHGGDLSSYHITAFFHEYGEILGGCWNKLPGHELVLNAQKIKIYNQYTKNTFNASNEDDEAFGKLMPSENEIAAMSEEEKRKSFSESLEKRRDFFTIPAPCYQQLSVPDMLDYSLYVVAEGDLNTYLNHDNLAMQRFNEMLKNGQDINVSDVRAAWWVDETARLAEEKLKPVPENVFRVGSGYSDKSKLRNQ